MYDWANSAFSTTVVAVFFGPYLTSITEGSADANGYIYLGGTAIAFDSYFTFIVSASVLLQVTILPILGALADYGQLRKKLLIFFSTLGAFTTVTMFFITDGEYLFGGLLFIIANISFGASLVFINAFLPVIASEDQRDTVSAKGFAYGYFGGGLLLIFNLIMFLFSPSLGLESALVARISLASAGVWWFGFSLVTFKTLRKQENPTPIPEDQSYLTIGFVQLAHLLQIRPRTIVILTAMPILIPVLLFLGLPVYIFLLPGLGPLSIIAIFAIKNYGRLPEAIKFLIAYLLYNDGIQTVIVVAAIFASQEIGLSDINLILLILMIQFVAFAGALLFAKISSNIGTKNAILLSLVIWTSVTIYTWALVDTAAELYLAGVVIGTVLGGSQALSRSLFSQMIPLNLEAEFFSFYEVSERGTSWLGPLLFGVANQITGSLRIGILSVIFFFIAGMIILPFVNVDKSIKERNIVSESNL